MQLNTYLKDTTTTSSCSAILAPLYPGIEELPLLKPPPYIHISTAFFASPVCGFVQIFKYRQSSLYFAPLLLNIDNTAIPAAVTFAAAKSAAVGRELEPDWTGHENPYHNLLAISPGTRLTKTHKTAAIERGSPIESNRRSESQIPNWRLPERYSQVLRDLRVVRCGMSTDRTTARLDRLSNSPVRLSFLDDSGTHTRCCRKGKEHEGLHGRYHLPNSIGREETGTREQAKSGEERAPTLVLHDICNASKTLPIRPSSLARKI